MTTHHTVARATDDTLAMLHDCIVAHATCDPFGEHGGKLHTSFTELHHELQWYWIDRTDLDCVSPVRDPLMRYIDKMTRATLADHVTQLRGMGIIGGRGDTIIVRALPKSVCDTIG